LTKQLNFSLVFQQVRIQFKFHFNYGVPKNLSKFSLHPLLYFVVCFDLYVLAKEGPNSTNFTLFTDPFISEVVREWVGETLPPADPGFNGDINKSLKEVDSSYMVFCEETATKVITRLIDLTSAGATTTYLLRDLTFDWVRCWNTTIFGNLNPFKATNSMMNAADNQDKFYSEMWRSDQARLYDQYLINSNCTEFDCRKDAFDQSVKDATGSSMCSVNIGASAWFWFTVMTTVGYGNQSPITKEGR
jgi:hypothetical protein